MHVLGHDCRRGRPHHSRQAHHDCYSHVQAALPLVSHRTDDRGRDQRREGCSLGHLLAEAETEHEQRNQEHPAADPDQATENADEEPAQHGKCVRHGITSCFSPMSASTTASTGASHGLGSRDANRAPA